MKLMTLSVLVATLLLGSCVTSQREIEDIFVLEPIGTSMPIRDEWIKDLERRVGGRLPDDYVAFLRKSNGGWIAKGRKPRSLDGPVLQGFFPVMTGRINTDGIGDALSVHETLSDGRLPPWFVPIAETSRATVYCLSVGAKDAGMIYDVYEDDDQDEVPFEKREHALVATSFTDFYRQVSENYAP